MFNLFFFIPLAQLFVRACKDCTEGEIASLVGIARTRLGVFLQVSIRAVVQCDNLVI